MEMLMDDSEEKTAMPKTDTVLGVKINTRGFVFREKDVIHLMSFDSLGTPASVEEIVGGKSAELMKKVNENMLIFSEIIKYDIFTETKPLYWITFTSTVIDAIDAMAQINPNVWTNLYKTCSLNLEKQKENKFPIFN